MSRVDPEYAPDADNRRPGVTNCQNVVVNSYYSTEWQDLEDDTATPNPPCGTTNTTSTYVWGLSYIDDMVERDDTTNGRQYVQFDANHDVTALTNSSGSVQQRVIYDPYGTRTVLTSGWANTSDSFSWVYNYQGGRYDAVTGKINFRNRDLDTVTGNWMERDPSGYLMGVNLYAYLGDGPGSRSDPSGLGPVPSFGGGAMGVRNCRKRGGTFGSVANNIYHGNMTACINACESNTPLRYRKLLTPAAGGGASGIAMKIFNAGKGATLVAGVIGSTVALVVPEAACLGACSVGGCSLDQKAF